MAYEAEIATASPTGYGLDSRFPEARISPVHGFVNSGIGCLGDDVLLPCCAIRTLLIYMGTMLPTRPCAPQRCTWQMLLLVTAWISQKICCVGVACYVNLTSANIRACGTPDI